MVGVDADAAGLYDGFRRARKAKLANAVFVVGSAEALPGALAGTAHEVRVHFPWGSLLRAVLAPDPDVVAGVAALLRPGGALTVLVSVVDRDRVEGVDRLDERTAGRVASRLAATGAGLRLDACRPATAADVEASHSAWAKRLGVGRSRPAWLLAFHRAGTG